jgi:hypothetical protein
MSSQYLLPCSCGQKVRIEPAQAGGQVACSCGARLTVPTLRGLRLLDVAPPDKSSLGRPASGRWGPVQAAMFSIGLLVTVASLIVFAYTCWQYLQVIPLTKDRTADINKVEGEQIEQMDLMQSLAAYEDLATTGLPEASPPLWIRFQTLAAQKRSLMIGTGIFALLGTIATLAALVIRTR